MLISNYCFKSILFILYFEPLELISLEVSLSVNRTQNQEKPSVWAIGKRRGVSVQDSPQGLLLVTLPVSYCIVRNVVFWPAGKRCTFDGEWGGKQPIWNRSVCTSREKERERRKNIRFLLNMKRGKKELQAPVNAKVTVQSQCKNACSVPCDACALVLNVTTTILNWK